MIDSLKALEQKQEIDKLDSQLSVMLQSVEKSLDNLKLGVQLIEPFKHNGQNYKLEWCKINKTWTLSVLYPSGDSNVIDSVGRDLKVNVAKAAKQMWLKLNETLQTKIEERKLAIQEVSEILAGSPKEEPK